MSTKVAKTKDSLTDLTKKQIGEDGLEKYSALQEFNKRLNANPNKAWVKVNDGIEYLPIRRIEDLLRSLFGAYQVLQHGEPKVIGNSIVVSCHLMVYHPVFCDWLTYAGVGAVPIQLKKGTENALDFNNINRAGLNKTVPAALGFAFSNAAKKIGRIFGSDLKGSSNYITFDMMG